MDGFDPTAFAKVGGAQIQSPLATGLIQAHQQGIKTGVTQEGRQQEHQIRSLAKSTMDAYKSNDSRGYEENLQSLAALDNQQAGQLAGFLGGMDKQNRIEAAYRIYSGATMGDNLDGQNQMLDQAIEIMGPDDPLTAGLEQIKNMPEGEEREAEMISAVQLAQNLGYLPTLTARQKAEAKTISERKGEIQKEVRGDLRKQMTEINKSATGLADNFRKIGNLVGEVEKGNRQATAQVLVALVKLGDPTSTVREGEMIMALNAQNPMAAIVDVLKKKGTAEGAIDAVARRIDPLNPNLVNTDDVLATANSLLSAQKQTVQSRLAEAMQQGEDNLTPEGYTSIFAPKFIDRIDSLDQLGTPTGGGGGGAETTTTVRRATDAQGTVYVEKNGTWVNEKTGEPYVVPTQQ